MSTKMFLEGFAEALGLPAGSIQETDRIADIEVWDSINALNVIAYVDETYGLALDAESFEKCKTVGDLAELVLPREG